jgi:hypothetical protein
MADHTASEVGELLPLNASGGGDCLILVHCSKPEGLRHDRGTVTLPRGPVRQEFMIDPGRLASAHPQPRPEDGPGLPHSML